MTTGAPVEPFASLSVGELLDRLSSEAPAPGGGPLAGLVTAMAAGLVAKVARASRERWDDAGGAAAQALALRERAEALALEDMGAHMVAVAALRLPPGEPPSEDRDGALGDALTLAADVPLLIACAAADTAALASEAAGHGDPDRRPDAQAAAILAAAAAQVAARLVEVNLATLPDDPRSAAAGERARAAAAAAAAARLQD